MSKYDTIKGGWDFYDPIKKKPAKAKKNTDTKAKKSTKKK